MSWCQTHPGRRGLGRECFDLCDCVAGRDVLRAVPVEGDDVDDDETLHPPIEAESFEQFRRRVRLEAGVAVELDSAAVRVVDRDDRHAIVAGDVAGGDVLAVAEPLGPGDLRRPDDLEEPDRTTAVLQGKLSNYDTDLFMPLLAAAAKLTGVDLDKELAAEQGSRSAASLRVVADHARAVTFLISDGVLPANEGRGYVLRKILRRGIRHGRLLGATKPFMHEMVMAVRDLMKDAYPELVETADRVSKIVFEEERRFAHTLDAGLARLEAGLTALRKERADSRRIALARDPLGEQGMSPAELAHHQYQSARELRYRGEDAFKLYDTFGLPFDFIMDTCRDAGISVDVEGFERAMEAQRERARASWKGGSKQSASPAYRDLAKTVFDGYRVTRSHGCVVLAIVKDGQGVKALNPGEEGEVVLDHTPFYADSGGQVGDIGILYDDTHTAIAAEVNGCTMPVQGVRAHKVKARMPITLGMKVDAVVHSEVREATMRNHTACLLYTSPSPRD